LLKNNSKILPINKNKNITLVGSGANNLGMQNGGWTVEWQGRMTPDFTILDKNNDGALKLSEVTSFYKDIYQSKYNSGSVDSYFKNLDTDSNGKVLKKEFEKALDQSPYQPDGISILDAMLSAVNDKKQVNYDPKAQNIEKNDLVVAVIGEYPYAEGYGDNPDIGLNNFDSAVLKNCYNSGNDVIVIMLSGRPLIINDHIDNWDGFIAAWLPGMAGEGITDILFGDNNPTGKLSFSWPKSVGQLPLNEGDKNYDPLFPLGHGLSY